MLKSLRFYFLDDQIFSVFKENLGRLMCVSREKRKRGVVDVVFVDFFF